jgi:hypothetical protein
VIAELGILVDVAAPRDHLWFDFLGETIDVGGEVGERRRGARQQEYEAGSGVELAGV